MNGRVVATSGVLSLNTGQQISSIQETNSIGRCLV